MPACQRSATKGSSAAVRLVVAMDAQLDLVDSLLRAEPGEPFVLAADEGALHRARVGAGDVHVAIERGDIRGIGWAISSARVDGWRSPSASRIAFHRREFMRGRGAPIRNRYYGTTVRTLFEQQPQQLEGGIPAAGPEQAKQAG
jgi:hypothetical protein